MMLLNILQCSGQPPQQRISQRKIQVTQRPRNPDVGEALGRVQGILSERVTPAVTTAVLIMIMVTQFADRQDELKSEFSVPGFMLLSGHLRRRKTRKSDHLQETRKKCPRESHEGHSRQASHLRTCESWHLCVLILGSWAAHFTSQSLLS